MGIGIQAYDRYTKKARKDAYDTIAKSASLALEEYKMDHPGATEATFQELVEQGYLSSAMDPSDKGSNCSGKVMVVTDKASGSKLSIDNYTVNVCCANYNYTYKYPEDEKSVDKYCKALPYDITKINDIKVLNVYPKHSNGTVGNQLKGWMDSYGKGIIHVTPVYITDFNNNPESYLGTNGNWKYDEVVFGFVDCNGNQDLSAKAANLVDQYLSNGGAAIFGHDTLTRNGCESHVNFNTLAKYVNLELKSGVAYKTSNKVTIQRKGVFTEYPYQIGDVGTELTIPTSHVYGQVANGDVWITFSGSNMASDLPANKIYLSTYGNNAFIQTGHSNGAATADEQKIIANIIFYMVAKQYVND